MTRALRRDAPVICGSCGREVARQARQQRFCSTRCRDAARTRIRAPATTLALVKNNERTADFAHGPPEKLNEIKGTQTRICAARRVLDVEIWGGRSWQDAVSSGGVAIQVSRVRPRSLVSS